jgi:hypothetical protein
MSCTLSSSLMRCHPFNLDQSLYENLFDVSYNWIAQSRMLLIIH